MISTQVVKIDIDTSAIELAIVEDGRVILGRFGVGPDGPAPAIVIDGDEAAQAKDGPRLRPGQAHALSLSSQPNRTSSTILQAQLESWDKVLKRLNKDAFFKKIVDSQKTWSERVAFYDLTNSADYRLAYEHYFPGKLPS